MRCNKRDFLLFFITLFSIFLLNPSYADTLDIQLSRDKVAIGETFSISFDLKGNSNNISPDFSALEKDFRILGTNYGNNISVVNGAARTQAFWQLTLEPLKVGELVIPEINFGNTKSPSRKIIVEGQTNYATHDITDAPPAFIQAEINTTKPYVQVQVLYTFKLFYNAQLENARIDLPHVKDVVFFQLGEGRNYLTTIKGKQYTVVEKKFAFFPKNAGEITIPPAYFQAVAYTSNANAGDDPFYVNTPKSLTLATQAFNLSVRKAPTSFQGSTWLPAKSLTVTEKWSVEPNHWELGNPVTRTIIVQAQGLRADQVPDLVITKMSGMNVYVDPPKRSNIIQSDAVIGTLEQKITYIPNEARAFTIPSIKIYWWDLRTDTNAVAQLPLLTVQAKGIVANPISTQTSVPANSLPKPTINLAKELKEIPSNPFYLSIWFWVAILLLVAWLVTLWCIWNKKSRNNINTEQPLTPAKVPCDLSKGELSDENFVHACEQGDAAIAQQYLLNWAKKQWQDTPLNLEKLRSRINDENFKNALLNLEQVIYAKKPGAWDGKTLLSAYQKMKKQLKSRMTKSDKRSADPLPPLNP